MDWGYYHIIGYIPSTTHSLPYLFYNWHLVPLIPLKLVSSSSQPLASDND